MTTVTVAAALSFDRPLESVQKGAEKLSERSAVHQDARGTIVRSPSTRPGLASNSLSPPRNVNGAARR